MLVHLSADSLLGLINQKQKIKRVTVIVFAVCFTVTFSMFRIQAQSDLTVTERHQLVDDLLGCDESVALQDIVVTNALKILGNGSVLIVVLRQGNGEDSGELVQRRLYNLRQYFKDRGSRLSAEKVMIVIGQSVTGNSRIEYYLDGRLYQRLLYPKNGYVCHSCCGPDENYYPEKEIYERQQKQKRKRRG